MRINGAETSHELLAAIERARNHVMTPEERFEQRVSFVYGQQDHDNPNPRTKDEIRAMMIEIYGRPAKDAGDGR